MILKRFEQTDKVTRGVLIHENNAIALTLENPWKGNTPNISCIPTGIYLCKRIDSPRFGETFEVTDVEGRTHILFHSGNVESQTKGCILLGNMLTEYKGEPAVLNSNKTVKKFMEVLSGIDSFSLNVSPI